MQKHPLVKLIGDAVQVYPKPCVNISGGIDSTIILHHLNEKCKEPIYTYTVGFTQQETEFAEAQKVADHYGTKHKNVLIDNMLREYPYILKHFKRPRFNLWPYWLAWHAHSDQWKTCYIGEGGDEHFGGYWYKPHHTYVENWVNFFTYVYPTYHTIYEGIFKIRLAAPLHPDNLDWQATHSYYDPEQNKQFLREAYKGILPDFVVNRKKLNGRKDYWQMWNQELKNSFFNVTPKTEEEIRELWNLRVTQMWLQNR